MVHHNPDARNYLAPPTGGDVAMFHASLDGYTPTGLVDASDLAADLGVGRVLVKDESNRLGLPAFKILGASWATCRAISDRLGLDYRTATVPSLRVALEGRRLSLVTATDGNHGRAVAVMARLLSIQARVYTPTGLTRAALDAIRGEGADLIELDGDYDDVVAFAAQSVDGRPEDLLIQDAAWEGYEAIPGWIVDGYATLFAETDAQLSALGLAPTHVVVPVGVGSLAQAAVAHYRRTSPHRPQLVSVEPVTADCVAQSLIAGRLLTVPTAPTVMTGLNCGTPSRNAWPYLVAGLDLAVTVTDDQAIAAVHRLAAAGIDAGPCGAATWAAAYTLKDRPAAGLNADSVVVLISTEGQQANPLPADDPLAAETIELLHRLVAIDSVNPSLVSGAAGETEITAFITSWAQAQGLQVDRFEQSPGRPSLLVSSRGTSTGKTLLLCGHTDTVGVTDMANPFKPSVDGDRIHGRGCYDMLAGLAAALIACREADRLRLPGRVVVAAVADEEHSSLGIQEVLPHIQADAAIVTEPTELTIVTAHRGFVWTQIDVVGVAAHGSRPHLGKDAILKTGPILLALDELNRQLRTRRHPRLEHGLLHASLISGGREESTIPGHCRLTIERRTLPGETLADVEADIETLLARCRSADPELEAIATTTLARAPFEIADEHPFVRIVTEAASRIHGPAELAGGSYWADSAFIAEAGIPTVLYGPTGEGAHADIEWVSATSINRCTNTLIQVAITFCR